MLADRPVVDSQDSSFDAAHDGAPAFFFIEVTFEVIPSKGENRPIRVVSKSLGFESNQFLDCAIAVGTKVDCLGVGKVFFELVRKSFIVFNAIAPHEAVAQYDDPGGPRSLRVLDFFIAQTTAIATDTNVEAMRQNVARIQIGLAGPARVGVVAVECPARQRTIAKACNAHNPFTNEQRERQTDEQEKRAFHEPGSSPSHLELVT